MNKHPLQLLAGAVCVAVLAWSSARAGDMKAEIVADVKLYHSHFGKTPFPNRTIMVDPQGIHFLLNANADKPEYTAMYSFFKLGGDFEVSVNYSWTPVDVPKGGYGVSCGILVETNDKKKSVAIARGNFPDKGSSYRVTKAIIADKKLDYQNEPLYPTTAKSGRLILTRKNKEVICQAADEDAEPKELCRIPFNDAAVQRVLIFADPGSIPTDLDAWITNVKIRADETSYHMTKQEKGNPWLGVYVGLALIVVGTAGFLIVRRIRTGRWGGTEF